MQHLIILSYICHSSKPFCAESAVKLQPTYMQHLIILSYICHSSKPEQTVSIIYHL